MDRVARHHLASVLQLPQGVEMSGNTRDPSAILVARSIALRLMLLSASILAADGQSARADPSITSPDGTVKFQLLGAPVQLRYQLTLSGGVVIEPSALAMLVDGTDLSRGVEIAKVEHYTVDERYPWNGVHSEAVDHCHGIKIGLTHLASGTDYTLEVRAYNDGIAYRHVIPGRGERVPDEAHEFVIPAGGTVWHHDFRGHYEGVHTKDDIAGVSTGTWCAPPLTVRLPGEKGYASITEGALLGYSGMGLQSAGNRKFVTRLGHEHPVSYPFELRFGDEEAKRLANPASVSGTITTPWRIVMVGADLNALVNCDIVHNVSPPPDPSIFPGGLHTAWLKPGRAVWKYLDGGESSLEGMKEFSRLAGELGFEYNLVEGFWRRWSNDELRELVDYSRERGVGILLWHHSGRLRTPAARREFFSMCQDAGVVVPQVRGQVRVRLGQDELDLAGVHRLDVADVGVEVHRGGPDRLVPEPVEGKDDVVGGQRLAVVKGNALPHLEGPGEPVLARLPPGGQGRHRLVLLIDPDEPVVELGAGRDLVHAGLEGGIQLGGRLPAPL